MVQIKEIWGDSTWEFQVDNESKENTTHCDISAWSFPVTRERDVIPLENDHTL